ncbi:hypothetical protein [Virgibacillus sp. 7505]|uniref:hypothetical protein n=1 Tax=Virgibacillus sp. 7505 TaxID=2022548 RepID=UPI00159548F3|nr:hypothetical protein [Virgibacillus sp. 7505]
MGARCQLDWSPIIRLVAIKSVVDEMLILYLTLNHELTSQSQPFLSVNWVGQ